MISGMDAVHRLNVGGSSIDDLRYSRSPSERMVYRRNLQCRGEPIEVQTSNRGVLAG